LALGRLQKLEGAHKIGCYNRFGREDAAVYMALGRKVYDGVGLVFFEHGGHRRGVPNVRTDKRVTWISFH